MSEFFDSEMVRQAMSELIPFTGKRPAPVIVPAVLGNDAGLVGVADLARN